MIEHRPCGLCRALVRADAGCAHWRPKVPLSDGEVERRAQAAQVRREQRIRQQAKAREAVEQFRRQQNLEVRG